MSSQSRFKRLLEPARLGTMNTRNRIVMSGMTCMMQPKGRNGVDLQRDYYEARAKGGTGLIIVGGVSVDYEVGRIRDVQLRIDEDRFIPAMAEIAEVIKKHGAKAAVQLHHAGSVGKSESTTMQTVAPSAIARPGYDMPKELTVDGIAGVVRRFAEAAERAKKSGFDGVEIAAGHRYIFAQFLSSAWNKRTDDYGGSLKNRARFLLETIAATRKLVGKDFPVWCRINGIEHGVEGGTTIEEAQAVAVMIEEAGVDGINVSAFPANMPYHSHDALAGMLPMYGPGYLLDLAAAVKKVVKIPIIVAGRISPERGEKVLRKNKADFIAMGRQHIVDPEFPNKVAEGRLDDIATCLYCNCCMDPLLPMDPATPRDCAVNAAKGREKEYEIKPAEKPKKILVVGGGPAGMEAARIAALRGHQVTLYEKEHRLGGELLLAGVMRHEYNDLARYLSRQIRKLGVEVHTGKALSPEMVGAIKPDVVIVATGPAPVVPNIPGVGGNNVVSSAGIKQAAGSRSKGGLRKSLWSLGVSLLKRPGLAPAVYWLTGFMVPFGRRVVVMGGGLAGVEMAHFLEERGKDVTLVVTEEKVVPGVRPMYLLTQNLLNRLVAKKVSMLTSVKYEEITDKGLVITDSDGKRRLIEADTVVLDLGTKIDTGLADELKDKAPEVYLVGDCIDPYGIREAIASGSRIARVV